MATATKSKATPDIDALEAQAREAREAHEGTSAALVAAEVEARAARVALAGYERELAEKAGRDTVTTIMPLREALALARERVEAAEAVLAGLQDEEGAALRAEYEARKRAMYGRLARWLPRRAEAVEGEQRAAAKSERPVIEHAEGWDRDGADDAVAVRTARSKLRELARLAHGDPAGRDGLGRRPVEGLSAEIWDRGHGPEDPKALREQARRYAELAGEGA